VSNPLYLSVVYQDSFAVTLGLKPGDRLISAAGTDLDPKGSMEEFKMIVQNNLGKTIPVTVEREGKKTELKMSVPKEIPSSFLY
jgi:S1-C subfamily serine protease